MKVAGTEQVLLSGLRSSKRTTALVDVRTKVPFGQTIVPRHLFDPFFLAFRPGSLLAPVRPFALAASRFERSRLGLSPGRHDRESGGAMVELWQSWQCCAEISRTPKGQPKLQRHTLCSRSPR